MAKNRLLFGLHGLLFMFYVGLLQLVSEGILLTPITFIFVIPLLLHGFAALGAYYAKPWGRMLSKYIGMFILLGIPIGTVIGVIILTRVGDKWEPERVQQE